MLVRYDSIKAVVDKATEVGPDRTGIISYGRSSWDMGIDFDAACQKAVEGDLSIVSTTTSALDRIQSMGLVEQTALRPMHVLSGGTRVDVPAYLAGSQRCMIRRTKQAVATRHVSIYCSLACSAAIESHDMLKRGCTILALLECLQTIQVSVDLWLLYDAYSPRQKCDYFQLVRIESQPLDLSSSGFAIAHPAFSRNVLLTLVAVLENSKGLWSNLHTSDHQEYERRMRPVLGMQENDVFIPPAHSSDPIMRTPEVWLEKSLKQVLA